MAILAPALLFAAYGDWLRRDIPNKLNAAIALMAPLYWWAAGFTLWPEIAIIVGLALALFLMFTFAFAIGAMGGGDVKMIGALALWMTPMQLPVMLIVMAIAGGVLTLAMLIHHRRSGKTGKPEIPYGIAIAIGGLWVVMNGILTTGAVTI
ncbi:A24 family peptidase [Parasphingopyxis algicola]|uniref:A24 family peptidase n=1 Tax=Parasphingopyxis algicola TaxID=2026624 RepID=UPI001FE40330|nr:prepilin peptidase [Parasphingopyxis algicola]